MLLYMVYVNSIIMDHNHAIVMVIFFTTLEDSLAQARKKCFSRHKQIPALTFLIRINILHPSIKMYQ